GYACHLPQRLVAALGCHGMGCPPLQSAMRSCVVVLLSPVRTNATRLWDGGPPPALEAAIAQDAVHTLVMPVLPGTPRVHPMGSDPLHASPGRHPLCHARWNGLTMPPPLCALPERVNLPGPTARRLRREPMHPLQHLALCRLACLPPLR